MTDHVPGQMDLFGEPDPPAPQPAKPKPKPKQEWAAEGDVDDRGFCHACRSGFCPHALDWRQARTPLPSFGGSPPPPPPPPTATAGGDDDEPPGEFRLPPSSDPLFPDSMTLGEAREKLNGLIEDGHICPCCHRRAQIYKRPINGTMARSLGAMYLAYGLDYGDLPALRQRKRLHHSNQEGMLAWFGLTEEEKVRRKDGGRAGFWRVTPLGERWLKGEATIPKYSRTYGAYVIELLGKQVSIYDTLKVRFNWRDVMNGTVEWDDL